LNTLVLYDSRVTHTEQLACEIAEKLKEHGQAETMRIEALRPEDIARVDLLVIGAPSEGISLTPAIEQFLDNVPPSGLLGKHVAVFDTRQHAPWLIVGSAARRIARRMRDMGAVLVASPVSFFTAGKEGPIDVGEEFKADEWAHLVVERARDLN
jgi:flavodoxin